MWSEVIYVKSLRSGIVRSDACIIIRGIYSPLYIYSLRMELYGARHQNG